MHIGIVPDYRGMGIRGEWIIVEYQSDVTKKTFFAFQHFEYHISLEHDEKPPQPKFNGNRFTGARDMAA